MSAEAAAGRPIAPGWRALLWLVLFVATLFVAVLPVFFLPAEWSQAGQVSAMLAAALLPTWVMLRWVDHRPFGAVGLAVHRPAWREWWLGVAVGAATLGIAVVLLAVAGSVRWVADAGTISEYVAALARGFVFFAVAAAAEEVIFRGYPYQAAVEGLGPWVPTIAFAVLFGVIHMGNPNYTAFGGANIVLAGIFLGVAYLRTRSLWFATGVHLGWNWAMSSVLDLPVSGLELDTPAIDAVERGADWWTGGAFGPEAGAAATVALLAATAWTLWTPRLAEPPGTRALGPLVDRRLGPEWPRGGETRTNDSSR